MPRREVPECLSGRDPGEPGGQGPVTSEGSEGTVGDHKGLLRNILGIGRAPKNAEADPKQPTLLPVHHDSKDVSVPVENRLHDRPVVHAEIVPCASDHPTSFTRV